MVNIVSGCFFHNLIFVDIEANDQGDKANKVKLCDLSVKVLGSIYMLTKSYADNYWSQLPGVFSMYSKQYETYKNLLQETFINQLAFKNPIILNYA